MHQIQDRFLTKITPLVSLGWLLSSSLGNSLSILLVLVNSLIKHIVILESFTGKKVMEDLAKVGIV
jgi:hypothetical protein